MGNLNPIFRRVGRNTLAADIKDCIGASTTFNAGDFLTFNGTSKTFGPMVGESDSQNFAGVAVASISGGKMASAYVSDTDASRGIASIPGPEFGDEVYATLKAGDAVVPGQELFWDPGTTSPVKNGVTVTVGTKSIGYYFGPSLTGAPTTGTVIPIKLGCRYRSSGIFIG